MDPRNVKLADLLVNYSCKLQKNENILIEYSGDNCVELVQEIVRDVYKAGGNPFVNSENMKIKREILLNCNKKQLEFMRDCQLQQMKGMDAYIAIRESDNTSELSDVPIDKLNLKDSILDPVLNYRVDETKWVILRYPNGSMAQSANMSTCAFEDFYYNVCTLDYAKMSKAMDPLKELMDKTNDVRIVGPGTELEFSIAGIQAVKCDGACNIPDGEVYTAPVRESMNGHISYNIPSLEQGFTFEDIKFEIKNGKIINATSNDTERINALLDTDEGSRYFGEFALGVHPYILTPMKDTLFDEKIAGSFHLTPGRCYEDAPNGNKSAVHWDLVMIQRPEYGGGEIYFDGRLIRKDGIFVVPELEGLNPENLK